MTEPPATRKTLADIGTRFQFYNELLDMWTDGLEAVNKAYAYYNNEKDLLRKKALTAAISLLEAERDRVSEWDMKRFELAREVDRIPKTDYKKGKNEETKETKETNDSKSGIAVDQKASPGESNYGT
jgi:hypothetical protein